MLACRVVVRGEGHGPHYGHAMDLVAQRYLVTVSGNDGKKVLPDAWALDTAQKPYAWQKLNPEGALFLCVYLKVYATASFALWWKRQLRNAISRCAWIAHALEWPMGMDTSTRSFAVTKIPTCSILDTTAGVWLDRHGMVTSSRKSKAGQTEDPSLELMQHGRHAASSVGGRMYAYGGLRGDVLLDDFLIAEDSLDSDFPMLTSETILTTTGPRANKLSVFRLMFPDDRLESFSSGGLMLNTLSLLFK
ncbi:hypothetical protein SSX86_013101 [Deinandra increscens subsp. villosa]|uniref:Uncharacterized protein n=1 Tax=Deinandra increscens subsp. villosa TaxID=3103831 RepID=A0AAP0H3W6_9ASTR